MGFAVYSNSLLAMYANLNPIFFFFDKENCRLNARPSQRQEWAGNVIDFTGFKDSHPSEVWQAWHLYFFLSFDCEIVTATVLGYNTGNAESNRNDGSKPVKAESQSQWHNDWS